MKSIAALISFACLIYAPLGAADEDLAKANNCLACHTVDKKILGPAFKDIAAIQGCSINTALARMQYALSKLRVELQEDYEALQKG